MPKPQRLASAAAAAAAALGAAAALYLWQRRRRRRRRRAAAVPPVLSPQQLAHFLERGYVVVEDVLTPAEVAAARAGLRATLAAHGVTAEDPSNLGKLMSTNGAGGVLDVFWERWKLDVTTHPKVQRAFAECLAAGYGSGAAPLWRHPFGRFDTAPLLYCDRVCYRVPTAEAKRHGRSRKRPLQRHLAPHFDCCPTALFAETAERGAKWRPVLGLVALTDGTAADTGGLEVAGGFHAELDAWAAPRAGLDAYDDAGAVPCLGDFSRVADGAILDRLAHVPVPPGALIMWDWRVPHASARDHAGAAPREAVYCTCLPDVPCNRAFVRRQFAAWEAGLPPGEQWNKDGGGLEGVGTLRPRREEWSGRAWRMLCPGAASVKPVV